MTIIQYLIHIFLENMWNKSENGIVLKKSKELVMSEIFGDFQHWAQLWVQIVYLNSDVLCSYDRLYYVIKRFLDSVLNTTNHLICKIENIQNISDKSSLFECIFCQNGLNFQINLFAGVIL